MFCHYCYPDIHTNSCYEDIMSRSNQKLMGERMGAMTEK